MRKIVFHLNCLEQGGAERVVTTLANRLVQEGYDVYIATEWTAENEFTIDERIHRVHVGLTKKQEKLIFFCHTGFQQTVYQLCFSLMS